MKKKDQEHEEECDEHEKPSLKVATTTWEKNQKHEENYNEHKVKVVVGDHGPFDCSHFKFRQHLKLPTILDGVSYSNKYILYVSKKYKVKYIGC